MARLKIALVASFAVVGLSAAPAQAFGPMMVLMTPMMMGGHQHGGDASHKEPAAGHADAPQAPVSSKHAEPTDDGRLPSNPPVAQQHVGSRETNRSDSEHDR